MDNIKLDEAVRACINVYLSIHVSHLNDAPIRVVECWKVGQSAFNNNKQLADNSEQVEK